MDGPIWQIELLLLVASLVAMLARRLRLPYTVGLTLAGIALAFIPLNIRLSLTKELIFFVFLPPLVFEAAFHIEWHEFKREMGIVVFLATFGVLLAAAATGVGLHYLGGWEWGVALMVGTLISATDPVSVLVTFKEAKVGGRLRLLVESESLLNDGVVAVLFAITLAGVGGGSVSAGAIALNFATTIVGGVVCGWVVALVLLGLAGQTDDHLVEITFTVLAAYGSFMFAEAFHFSGVLATMTAGLLVGNRGSLGAITDRGREAVVSFWEYVGFIANSFIFLLIGLRLTRQDLATHWKVTLILIVLVTLGRAIGVYFSCLFFRKSAARVERRHQHILVWGGLRGALALALALGLPEDFPRTEEIRVVIFGVVAFSVLVQGVTMTPLLRRLKIVGSGSEATEENA